jgi:hypothetical protein
MERSACVASCMGSGEWYQVVDRLSAESADQVERKLDHEDHEDEGRHDRRSDTAVCKYWCCSVAQVSRLTVDWAVLKFDGRQCDVASRLICPALAAVPCPAPAAVL